MRPSRLAVLIVALAALAGCDSSSSDSAAERPRTTPRQRPPALTYEERVIRGWLLALDRQDYDGAAYYFAPGAIIDQGDPYRLRDASQARTFNASLPCRADLIDVEDEGRKVLATFRLRRGPGGPCSGEVQVRYTIREGKFTEWRQLPQRDPPPGDPA